MAEEKKGWLGRLKDTLNTPITLPGFGVASQPEVKPVEPAPALTQPEVKPAQPPAAAPVAITTQEVSAVPVEALPVTAPPAVLEPGPVIEVVEAGIPLSVDLVTPVIPPDLPEPAAPLAPKQPADRIEALFEEILKMADPAAPVKTRPPAVELPVVEVPAALTVDPVVPPKTPPAVPAPLPVALPQPVPPAATIAAPPAAPAPPPVAPPPPVPPAAKITAPPAVPAQPASPASPPAALPAATITAASAPEPPRKPSWWEILNTPITFGPTKEIEPEETLMAKLRFKMGYADTPEEAAVLKAHWLEKFQERLQRTRDQFVARIERLTRGRTSLDDDLLEELEEILLQSDVGVNLTDQILQQFKDLAKQKRFLPEEIMPSMLNFLRSQLAGKEHTLQFVPGQLNIMMLVGVNGTGKTTTAGKLALRERVLGRKVILAAADTFRAAATEQLCIWADRVGVEIVHHQEGADAGAVVFDALQAARARHADVVIIDTAGRLHTKFNLMEEMKKLRRIIDREAANACIEVLLVLDANTGQNGLRQAEVFGQAVGLTGVILTKLDGTAKGGVIFAIQSALNIPIKLIGIGEGPEDLQEFDPELFVQALFAKPEEVAVAPGPI